VAKRDRNRQKALRSFLSLCDQVGFPVEPHQKKIASCLLGPEREKLITLPRKNGKSRLIGAFAAWHLLRTPSAQVIVVANSKEQAEIIDRYARQVAMHPSVEQEFEPRFRELRGPDGSTLQVKSADAGRLLGLTPTLAIYDEFCVAKDDDMYTALRSALLPGATMFTVTTAGWGAESPLGRLRARCLAQPDIRRRGFLTDCRGPNIRALEWMVPEELDLDDFRAANRANPLSLITPKWLKEQREALNEIDYQRFHLNRWVGRIGSWLPAGAWQACANGRRPQEGTDIWVGVDLGGARADSAVVWMSKLGDDHFAVDAAIFSGEDGPFEANQEILRLAERFRIREIVYDNWRASMIVRGLEERGLKCTVFGQSDTRMMPASAALYQAIVEKRIHHPNHERLNEHVAAAVARQSRRSWRVDQAERGTPVDGVIALCMAHEAVTAPEPAPARVLGGCSAWEFLHRVSPQNR
jgi:phage terminase large subunit-like protein